jgi:hypothetical protein
MLPRSAISLVFVCEGRVVREGRSFAAIRGLSFRAEYPQPGQPFLKSAASPEKPHLGHLIEEK